MIVLTVSELYRPDVTVREHKHGRNLLIRRQDISRSTLHFPSCAILEPSVLRVLLHALLLFGPSRAIFTPCEFMPVRFLHIAQSCLLVQNDSLENHRRGKKSPDIMWCGKKVWIVSRVDFRRVIREKLVSREHFAASTFRKIISPTVFGVRVFRR